MKSEILVDFDGELNALASQDLDADDLQRIIRGTGHSLMKKIVARALLTALQSDRAIDGIQAARLISERQCGRPRVSIDLNKRQVVLKVYNEATLDALRGSPGQPALEAGLPGEAGEAG